MTEADEAGNIGNHNCRQYSQQGKHDEQLDQGEPFFPFVHFLKKAFHFSSFFGIYFQAFQLYKSSLPAILRYSLRLADTVGLRGKLKHIFCCEKPPAPSLTIVRNVKIRVS